VQASQTPERLAVAALAALVFTLALRELVRGLDLLRFSRELDEPDVGERLAGDAGDYLKGRQDNGTDDTAD
jgi:hypothetical protein